MKSLKLVLKINAISSGATGVITATFAPVCSSIFGVDANALFVGIGIFLVIFAVVVFIESSRARIDASRVKIISMLDITWVAGSIIVLDLFWSTLSAWGTLITAGVAAWVAMMAFLQLTNLRKIGNVENGPAQV